MKLLFSLSLLLTSTFSWGWTFAELQGTYRVKPSLIPTTITVKFDSRGNVNTTQRILGRTLNCSAPSVLRDDIIKASLECNHDQKIAIEVDLTEVEDLESFRTKVWSSKSGRLRATFTKVQ